MTATAAIDIASFVAGFTSPCEIQYDFVHVYAGTETVLPDASVPYVTIDKSAGTFDLSAATAAHLGLHTFKLSWSFVHDLIAPGQDNEVVKINVVCPGAVDFTSLMLSGGPPATSTYLLSQTVNYPITVTTSPPSCAPPTIDITSSTGSSIATLSGTYPNL